MRCWSRSSLSADGGRPVVARFPAFGAGRGFLHHGWECGRLVLERSLLSAIGAVQPDLSATGFPPAVFAADDFEDIMD